MTTGLPTLGTVFDLLDASFSGFGYPGNAQVTPLLGDGTTSGGNAVIQSSALTLRRATLAFVAETADAEVVRGYYESHETVDFTDHDGSIRDVVVLEHSRSLRFGEVWDVAVTLVEIAEPGS